jgi:hypothetical protein
LESTWSESEKSHNKDHKMNIKSAFTGNKVAAHYGLSDGDKLSTTGALGLTYQLFAVLVCTAIVLFSGTEAVSAAGLPVKALLTLVTAFGFFAGAKLLIRIADSAVKRIATTVSNKVLHFVVTLALLLAFLGVVMSWPAVFLFALSKLAPATVGFAGWSNAFSAGFGVLCCDTVLGGLTGVSLLSGKRVKILASPASSNAPAATVEPEAPALSIEPKSDADAKPEGDAPKTNGDAGPESDTK